MQKKRFLNRRKGLIESEIFKKLFLKVTKQFVGFRPPKIFLMSLPSLQKSFLHSPEYVNSSQFSQKTWQSLGKRLPQKNAYYIPTLHHHPFNNI